MHNNIDVLYFNIIDVDNKKTIILTIKIVRWRIVWVKNSSWVGTTKMVSLVLKISELFYYTTLLYIFYIFQN